MKPTENRLTWGFKRSIKKTDGSIFAAIHNPPVPYKDKVYFSHSDNNLYCVHAINGKVLWKFETGGWINSLPVVQDDIVYFDSTDNYLYAIDAESGLEKWKFKTNGGLRDSPVIDGDTIYFRTWRKYFYAIGKTTCKKKWQVKVDVNILEAKNNLVYYSAWDGNFYVANSITCKIEKTFKAEISTLYECWLVDGVIYYVSRDRFLYALDTTSGKLKWRSTLIIPEYQIINLIYSANTVFFSEYRGAYPNIVNVLHALDGETGKEKWIFEMDLQEYPGVSAPVVFDKAVYIGSRNGNLYVLDLDNGNQKWVFETGDNMRGARGSIESSPVIFNGDIYFYSNFTDLPKGALVGDAVSFAKVYSLNLESKKVQWAFYLDKKHIDYRLVLANEMIFFVDGLGDIYAIYNKRLTHG